ncbi:MAG: hypothetical protein IT462_13125 [Planctomycetes bacterium]|nr:hypothetical protein [Planctomycetota bacterium]
MSKWALIGLLAAFCILRPSELHATSASWDNGGGDNLWSNPQNWDDSGSDPATVPGPGETATFPALGAPHAVTVDATAPTNVFAVTFGGATVLTVSANFSITGPLSAVASVTLQGSSQLTAFSLDSGGQFSVSPGASLVVGPANATIYGTLEVGTGGSAVFGANLTLTDLTIMDGDMTVGGLLTLSYCTLDCDGTVYLDGPGLTEIGSGKTSGAGKLVLTAAVSTIQTDGGLELIATDVAAGASVTQSGDALLGGDLTLFGDASWTATGGSDTSTSTAADDITISLVDGVLALQELTLGNWAGRDFLIEVSGSGTFTAGNCLVIVADIPGRANRLTLTQSGAGSISFSGNLFVYSDPDGALGDGSSVTITQETTVTCVGAAIGSSNALGPIDNADGSFLELQAGASLLINYVGTSAFTVQKRSLLRVTGTALQPAQIKAIADPYYFQLAGSIDADYLVLGGYTSLGVLLASTFGAAGMPLHLAHVDFTDGVPGGTHLFIECDLVAARGGVADGQARFTEIRFDNSIGDTGNIVRTGLYGSAKIVNAIDDYGLGFPINALEAETGGVVGFIGGDTDGSSVITDVSWGPADFATTLSAQNYVSSPTIDLAPGYGQVLLVVQIDTTSLLPESVINSVTLTLNGTDVASDLRAVQISFTELGATSLKQFAFPSNPTGTGDLTFSGDTITLTVGTPMLMVVRGTILSAAPGHTLRVQFDASTQLGVDPDTLASGVCDSGTRNITYAAPPQQGSESDGGGCIATTAGPCWAILGLLGLAALRRRRKQARVER